MKSFRNLILVPLVFCLSVVACVNLTPGQAEKAKATGSYIASRMASIAGRVLLNSALGSVRGGSNSDFMHSAATGLRSEMLNIVTDDDVRRVVDIWSPERPEWGQFAGLAAEEFQRARAAGMKPADAVEAIAQGTQTPAL